MRTVPQLEANICGGKYVLPIQDPANGDWAYVDCPGCVGCDYDTVSARMADSIPADPFARFPCDTDEEW